MSKNIIIDEDDIIADIRKPVGGSGQITIGTKLAGVKIRAIVMLDDE